MAKDTIFRQFTRGGQTTFHDVRMFFQINKTLVHAGIMLFALMTVALTIFFTGLPEIKTAVIYHFAKILSNLGARGAIQVWVHDKPYALPYEVIAGHAFFIDSSVLVATKLLKSFFMSLAIAVAIFFLLGWFFIGKGRARTEDDYIRGSQFLEATGVKKIIESRQQDSEFCIDGFPLVKNTEVQHFLIHGTIGTGKSQLMMKFLDILRARGDRVIIYDKGCSFTARYFDETRDVLLNPYDSRCAFWDLWHEARNDSDLENLAESLIPIEGESQPFFVHAARTVFAASASRMREDADCSHEKLLKFLITDELKDMESYLKGTAAATLVSDKVDKMAISVRAMITTYVRSLSTLLGLEKSDKKPFSIRDYILDDKARGWLFISSNGEKQKSLKPLMSMWLSIASLALLSLPENPERRIWFICDELPTLHKLPFLGETIAEVRKFGGCFMLGMQNFSQLAKVYGKNGAGEIFDLLNTRFFFRSPSADMAQLASRELGEEEIDEVKESTSYGANSIRDGVSLSKQRIKRALVDYSEIMNLKDMVCFLRLPGNYPVTKLALELKVREPVTQGFIERPMVKSVHFTESPDDGGLAENTTEKKKITGEVEFYM